MSFCDENDTDQADVLANALNAIEAVAEWGAIQSTHRITVDGVDYALSIRKADPTGL